ncbi:topoisomerase [Bacillus sp. Cr_A10]|uniref:topoisomerase n=1 Tax=Bacillus sp. Cr_A10 TaxID=3033993 RepID=UPI0023D9DAEB|nr:topoisomerase [Bacillus sp. Cr_A10]MDF2066658.1 topoisomerase [Bacillus sp. Cr_A10]
MKKVIISGILFSLILLVGCNGEPEVEVIDAPNNGENEANLLSESESNFLSELQNEIIVSITEQTGFDSESIAIMLGGSIKEISVSVSFPKDVKVDDTMIQQIVEDSIKKVSETENVTISEENITIKIEKY